MIEYIVGIPLLAATLYLKGKEVLGEAEKNAKKSGSTVGEEIFNTTKSDMQEMYKRNLKKLSKEELEKARENKSGLEPWKVQLIDEVYNELYG